MNSFITYFNDHIDRAYPLTFIDVGAMGGIPKKWSALSGVMKVLAFEPDEREFKKLVNSPTITYFNYALWERSEDLKYRIARGAGKSSFYFPNKDFLKQFEDESRHDVIKEEFLPASRVKSLDAIIKENQISDCDFIKLDTQGSELKILMGGKNEALSKIFGANIEVEFAEIYKGQCLFRDIDAFMADHGFELIDLRRAFWKRKDYYDYVGKGQLVFGDALYFRTKESMKILLTKSADADFARSKLFKSILTCLAYRVFDSAVSLVHLGLQLNIISKKDSTGAMDIIKTESKRGALPFFPGRNFLYKVANRLSQILKPKSYLGWADGDNMIGNVKDF